MALSRRSGLRVIQLGFCLCLLVCGAVAADAEAADSFAAGAAVVSISPDKPLPVSGGMGAPRPSTGRRGELTARAVALRNGDTTIVIAAVDLLGFPSVLGDRVRAKIANVPAENILIAATHTHSAPDCYAFPDGQGGSTADLAYIDFVVEQTAAAIRQAVDNLQPAKLRWGMDRAEGKIAYNYYAPALYDQRMNVLQAAGENDAIIFTLVNYATHPEVLGNELGLMSPDLVGPLCDKLEQDLGGVGIFVNGAQGGMITADNRLLDQPKNAQEAVWEDKRDWDECLRIGHLMASEATRIVADSAWQESPSLYCQRKLVEFPVESEAMWQVLEYSPLGYPHDRERRSVTVAINLLNIGAVQILTIPGEALPNIGFYLKRKMNSKFPMLFGLTNEAFGYILTEVDFASFPRYDYVSRVSLGEQTGEIFIRHALEMIEQAPRPTEHH